jgi:hypothetical protein
MHLAAIMGLLGLTRRKFGTLHGLSCTADQTQDCRGKFGRVVGLGYVQLKALEQGALPVFWARQRLWTTTLTHVR